MQKDLILNQQTLLLSQKKPFYLAPERFVGPGETHHSKQRERGRSHLYGEVFVENKTLHPPGTTHCHSALGRATFGKGAQAGCESSGFFNPCTDVTLVSIHIPPSMWGSNCEGPPTVWELIPTDLGAESPQSWQPWTAGDSLTSPAGILQTGLGRGWGGICVH